MEVNGHSFVPIAAKWLASGTNDDDDDDDDDDESSYTTYHNALCLLNSLIR